MKSYIERVYEINKDRGLYPRRDATFVDKQIDAVVHFIYDSFQKSYDSLKRLEERSEGIIKYLRS